MRSNCAYFCFIFSNLTTDPVFVKLKINAMSLVIGKMQTKTTMSYITAYSVECLKLKKKTNRTKLRHQRLARIWNNQNSQTLPIECEMIGKPLWKNGHFL